MILNRPWILSSFKRTDISLCSDKYEKIFVINLHKDTIDQIPWSWFSLVIWLDFLCIRSRNWCIKKILFQKLFMIIFISKLIIILLFRNFSHTKAVQAWCVCNDQHHLDCNLKSHLYNSRLLYPRICAWAALTEAASRVNISTPTPESLTIWRDSI